MTRDDALHLVTISVMLGLPLTLPFVIGIIDPFINLLIMG